MGFQAETYQAEAFRAEAMFEATMQATQAPIMRPRRHIKPGKPETREERMRRETIAREQAAERDFRMDSGDDDWGGMVDDPGRQPPRTRKPRPQSKPTPIPKQYRLYVYSSSGITVYDTRGDFKKPYAPLIEITGPPKVSGQPKRGQK